MAQTLADVKLLLAEDKIGEDMVAILNAYGIRNITLVKNGIDAIDALEGVHLGTYNFIISDTQMADAPEQREANSGETFLKAARQFGYEGPIILAYGADVTDRNAVEKFAEEQWAQTADKSVCYLPFTAEEGVPSFKPFLDRTIEANGDAVKLAVITDERRAAALPNMGKLVQQITDLLEIPFDPLAASIEAASALVKTAAPGGAGGGEYSLDDSARARFRYQVREGAMPLEAGAHQRYKTPPKLFAGLRL